MSRAILVIDADAGFQTLLRDQLAPYGFDIVIASDGADAMTRLPKVQPALLVIAVEEPDKQGFATFNKAKKGVASAIPIVLATATVAPDSFTNHRRLKLHADEYIDKRSLSADELLGKIDNLIGLGEMVLSASEILPPSLPAIDLPPLDLQAIGDNTGDLPVEVDEVPMELSDGDLVLEETFGEDEVPIHTRTPVQASVGAGIHVLPSTEEVHDKPTSIGGPLDEGLLSETDAAFDALLGDDAPPAPRPEAAPEPAPAIEAPPPDDGDDAGSLPLLIEPDASRGPEPIEELVPSAKHEAAAVPVSIGDVSDHAPPPPAEPAPPPPSLEPPTVKPGASGPSGPTGGGDPAGSAGGAGVHPRGIDLGLEELATRANEEQTSGVHDRRQLQKVHDLEREVARLKAEAERARDGSGRVTGAANKDFLNLREMISARDKEILELRTAGTDKERALTEARERLRQMTHAKTVLETKNNQLEQKFLADSDRAEAATAALKGAEQRAADAQARLAEVEHAARTEIERMAAAVARADKARTDADAATIAERGAKSSAIEQERTRALAAQKAELEAAHAKVLAERDQDLEDQISGLRQAHAAELAEVEAAHRTALAEAQTAHGTAIAEAQAAHRTALADAQAAHARELAAERERLSRESGSARDELARELANARAAHEAAREAHEAALDAQKAEHEAEAAQLRQALSAMQDAATAAESDHAEALAAAGDRHQRELAALKQSHARELAAARDEAGTAVAEAEQRLNDEIAGAQAAARSELEQTVAQHEQIVAQHAQTVRRLEGELATLRRSLSEAQAEAETDKAELTTRLEAARDAALAELRERLTGEQRALEDEHAGALAEKDAELATAMEQHRAAFTAAAAAHAEAMTKLRGDQDVALRTQRETDRANHDRTISALRADFESNLEDAHDETAEVQKGLASARDQIRALEQQLATASASAQQRDEELRAQAAAVEERDARIAELRADIEALENENAQYQEQVLKAYQKIKADEATVTRAKKALAIALTALDEEKKKDEAGG